MSRNYAVISIGLLSAGSTVSMPMVQPEIQYQHIPTTHVSEDSSK